MKSRAILWDMDGTLLDSEPVHAAAFEDAVAELGVTLPHGFHDALLGASVDRVHEALIAASNLDMSLADWTACKWAHYQRRAHAITKREPTASMVPLLHGRGVPMALVSNSTADEVQICLEATGMSHFLPITVSRNDVTNGKPAPEPFLRGAERLGVDPADCLVVEDSPTGAQAGVAAGMTVLFHPQVDSFAAPEGAFALAAASSPANMIETFLKTGQLA